MQSIQFEGISVAVTGGAGLIGSFLADELDALGARVAVIDDFSKGQRKNLAQLKGRVEIREGDLERPNFAIDAIEGCKVVFHLASRAYGIGYSKGRHTDMLRHNELITNNILEAVAKHRPAHLLITSSSCIYDDNGPDTLPELSIFEGQPEFENYGYGWAKRFLEQKTEIYARETNVPSTIVRPFNIYGERYRWVGEFSQAIPMLVKRVLDGEDPVVIWGSGSQRRNYLHARDCARMMVALVQLGHTAGPVNIGTEETISLSELTLLICQITGLTPELQYDTTKPEGRFVKSADMTLFRSLLPRFTVSVKLEEGLENMVHWHNETFGPS